MSGGIFVDFVRENSLFRLTIETKHFNSPCFGIKKDSVKPIGRPKIIYKKMYLLRCLLVYIMNHKM